MINTAIAAARVAGETLRQGFGQGVQINESTAHDLKIQADVDAQAQISKIIFAQFPDHKILGEEEGDTGNPNAEIEWIIDPIDGTLNYAYGLPHFCVSIAARDKNKMLLGVIYDPMREELFTVTHDGPALLNGRPLQVSPRTALADCCFVIGFAKSQEAIEKGLKLFEHYAPRLKKLRMMGSAALDIAYVAAGRLDAYMESNIQLWDVAAGNLMVERAGGRVQMELNPHGKSYRIVAQSGHHEIALP
jgi:myo-inositol-1(or 4)-monophosphatase